jgi:hypothetical protein
MFGVSDFKFVVAGINTCCVEQPIEHRIKANRRLGK